MNGSCRSSDGTRKDELLPEAERQSPEHDAQARGRTAKSPWQIPWHGWKDVLWRASQEVADDGVVDLAASVAFFGLIALFPALIATVSMYGLLADPADVVRQIYGLSAAVPRNARTLVIEQLNELQSGSTSLHLGFLVGLGVALFAASGGVAGLLRGINKAYDERETRGWVRFRALALLFTVSFVTFVIASVGAVALLPAVLQALGLGTFAQALVRVVRWPGLAAAILVGLAFLYRYAPNRTPPRWQWVAPGAILGATIWTLASLSFSLYAENFGSYNETYGTLGGVVVLGLWMFLSAFSILLGAELNAELERQTAEDSTIGPSRPMGARRATVADRLGAARPASTGSNLRAVLRDALTDLNRPRRSKQAVDDAPLDDA